MRKALWTFFALSGCATQYPETYHAPHPLREVDVPTAPYVEGANAEAVDGSLTWEDGCLLFRSEAGDRILPIWPRASVFNGTSLIFHRPGRSEQPLLVNQEIEIGGETLPPAYALANFGTYVQRCGGKPFFVADVAPAD
ncbi:hypothetical protein [Sphingomonas sp.]|uniref:hypothetical protein n=1 Tax=Sphingomonas sp. TaxID=28214 RepID=UPI0025D29A39|nr:hypothetical protein [Sphingomonas sp.]MBV9528176.1 hypothetical protein [Sphingomonas sp.]